MSIFKILLMTSAFILSAPFRAPPFPNHFPLFLYTFPLPFTYELHLTHWVLPLILQCVVGGEEPRNLQRVVGGALPRNLNRFVR